MKIFEKREVNYESEVFKLSLCGFEAYIIELEPMFLEVGLETTIDLVIGLPEVGVLIHTIMILLHREGRIMTVGIAFQIEAGIIAGFKEAEVVMA